MPTVAVLGVSGLVGGLVADQLAASGIAFVGIGRAPRTGSAAVHGAVDRVIASSDGEDLTPALSGVDVVIDAIGDAWRPTQPGRTSNDRLTTPVLDASRRVGAHLVDLSPVQAQIMALHGAHDACVASGTSVVAGAGFQHVIGDTLAHLAGTATRDPRDIHVAYTLPGRGGLLAGASPGRRASAATSLTTPMYALVGGVHVEELLGEQRRLAWFPRPVGPAHAAGVPGGEAISVPLHLPDVGTVRTYVALSGWRSELLQFAGNAARFEPARRRLEHRVRTAGRVPGPAARRGMRWGCVAEANGRDGVARAWAYGHDPYRLTAVSAVSVAELLLAGRLQPGVVAPADAGPPNELLDRLALHTDLRWSITRPDPGAAWPRPVHGPRT